MKCFKLPLKLLLKLGIDNKVLAAYLLEPDVWISDVPEFHEPSNVHESCILNSMYLGHFPVILFKDELIIRFVLLKKTLEMLKKHQQIFKISLRS